MNFLKRFLAMTSLVALAACGGGGGDPGEPGFGPGAGGGNGGGGGSTPVAADLVLVLSSSSLPNDGSQTVTATVTTLDANRAALAAVPVTVSVDNGAVVTPSAAVTDAQGVLTATVGIGADRSNRTITLTAVSGTLTRTAAITVRDPIAGGGSGPTLELTLSTTSISAATPAVVTATLRDAQGAAVPSQVVTFAVVRGLASTNVTTALTRADGTATAVLSPTSSTSAGADEIAASVSYAGVSLQQTAGFDVQATPVTLGALTSAVSSLSAYGQTTLTLSLSGASVSAPVAVSFASSCVAQGKATLSPDSFTATSNTVSVQYSDNGCGAVQASDQLQAVVTSTGATSSLSLPIARPDESSVAFVQAAPEQIFLRGSGFTESSVVTFEVRDRAGNPLPNSNVELRLLSGAGGVTMEGRAVDVPVTLPSNAQGRVAVRVNSGTVPTPVRVSARLVAEPSIATVSSNLSVAVGLPSQINFSLSQNTINIEGFNIDGTTNTYTVFAADRSGNPVPDGTSINFVTEGGQVEAIRQTQITGGIASTTANFVSAEPRPADGRVTVTTYTLGEESFIDLDGDNGYDSGEPFQDLGNVFKDRNFDGAFDAAVDETVPLSVSDSGACAAPGSTLLLLDASIPSRPGTCSGAWSGAGQVYVRRATVTVLSTSAARPLWASTSGLSASCQAITLQVGPQPSDQATFTLVAGDTWYGGASDVLSFIVADANPGSVAQGLLPRLNPMAAGTAVSASTPTSGLTVTVGGGSVVPSTAEASGAAVAYTFTDPAVNSGVIFVTFTSPSGVGTTVSVPVVRAARPSACPT